MAVDSVERTRLREENTRIKEEYRRKEKELEKRHHKQIQQVKASNAQAMKSLADATQKALDAQRKRTNEALTDRDIKYQSQIQDLQKMNRERVRELGERNELRLQEIEGRRKSELERIENREQVRFDRMKTGLENELTEREKLHNEYAANVRVQQKEGMQKEEKQLRNHHSEQTEHLRNVFEEKLAATKSDYNREKTLRDKENKEHKIDTIEQRQKNSDQLMNAVKKERNNYETLIETKDSKYQQEFANLQEDFDKKQREKQAMQNKTFGQVKEDIYGRANRREASLERQLSEEQTRSAQEKIKLNRLNNLQQDNLRRNLGNQIDKLQETKEILVDASNEQNAENMLDLKQKMTKQFHNQNSFYEDKINTMETLHKRAYRGEVGRLNAKVESTEHRADERIEKMDTMYEKYKDQTKEHYDKSLQQMRQNYLENLSQLRNAKDQERFDMETRLKTAMRQSENVAEKKLSSQRVKYESQIEILKDEHNRESRRLQENHKKIMDAVQKGHETQMRSKDLEMKERLEQQRVAYERKIENMQNNFEVQKAEWARIQRS